MNFIIYFISSILCPPIRNVDTNMATDMTTNMTTDMATDMTTDMAKSGFLASFVFSLFKKTRSRPKIENSVNKTIKPVDNSLSQGLAYHGQEGVENIRTKREISSREGYISSFTLPHSLNKDQETGYADGEITRTDEKGRKTRKRVISIKEAEKEKKFNELKEEATNYIKKSSENKNKKISTDTGIGMLKKLYEECETISTHFGLEIYLNHANKTLLNERENKKFIISELDQKSKKKKKTNPKKKIKETENNALYLRKNGKLYPGNYNEFFTNVKTKYTAALGKIQSSIQKTNALRDFGNKIYNILYPSNKKVKFANRKAKEIEKYHDSLNNVTQILTKKQNDVSEILKSITARNIHTIKDGYNYTADDFENIANGEFNLNDMESYPYYEYVPEVINSVFNNKFGLVVLMCEENQSNNENFQKVKKTFLDEQFFYPQDYAKNSNEYKEEIITEGLSKIQYYLNNAVEVPLTKRKLQDITDYMINGHLSRPVFFLTFQENGKFQMRQESEFTRVENLNSMRNYTMSA